MKRALFALAAFVVFVAPLTLLFWSITGVWWFVPAAIGALVGIVGWLFVIGWLLERAGAIIEGSL